MSDTNHIDYQLSQSGFAPADFDTTGEYTSGYFFERLPGSEGIQEIVSQSLSRHVTEGVQKPSPSNWRKGLREMMLAQTESVIEFLVKPSVDQAILGRVEGLLLKYSLRCEVDTASIKSLAELLDESPGSIEKEIETLLTEKGGSTLANLKDQMGALIDLYKETGERVLEYENQVKLRIDKVDTLHKQVSSILQLKVNDATEGLVDGMTKYLQTTIHDLNIEPFYKTLIGLYKKHMVLRDAIQLFRTGASLPSEPVCAICLTDSISYAIVPCGHTFCVTCCRRMVHECSLCRSKIRDRLKIYIS